MSKYSTDIKSSSKKNKRLLIATAFVCAIVFIFLGCDRETRHQVLTFFFEGVPPLDGDPNEASGLSLVRTVVAEDGTSTMVPVIHKTPEELAILEQSHSSKHKIIKDCDKCHEGNMRSGRTQLKKTMPDLCYTCHKNLGRLGGKLHGPFAVGACIFCHEPHRSKYVHLQKYPQPELCYRCHKQQEILNIKDHEKMIKQICTNCHDPHASLLPKLLKPVTVTETDPNETELNPISEIKPLQ